MTPPDSPKHQNNQFTLIEDEEDQHVFTSEKLVLVNFWHFGTKMTRLIYYLFTVEFTHSVVLSLFGQVIATRPAPKLLYLALM